MRVDREAMNATVCSDYETGENQVLLDFLTYVDLLEKSHREEAFRHIIQSAPKQTVLEFMAVFNGFIKRTGV